MKDVELIYHPPHADPHDQAYAKAIKTLLAAPGSDLSLVSPYLSLNILESIIAQTPFRLVTDLEQCFQEHETHALLAWFERHQASIRHMPGVHAKVILTPDAALIGSANLTQTAFTKRLEMSCLLRHEAQLRELNTWFEQLWRHSAPLERSALDAIRRRPHTPPSQADSFAKLPPRGNLGWMAQAPQAPQAQHQKPILSVPKTTKIIIPKHWDTDHADLARQLHRTCTTREHAQQILALMHSALIASGLDRDDPRLHLNFGRRPILINIGQRYVAWYPSERAAQHEPSLGFLLDSFDVAREAKQLIPGSEFGAFTKNKEADIPAFYVPSSQLDSLPQLLIDSWHRGIKLEVARAKKSSYIKSKRPFLFDALMDESLQAQLLHIAFPQEV